MITRRTALRTGIALLSSSFTTAMAAASFRSGSRQRTVRLRCGRVLSYREYGNPAGPLVFYFHGTPGSRHEAGLIEDDVCCAGVRLIAVDRPGIGCSSYAPCRQILDWPRDVVQLAECLGHGASAFGILALSGGAPYAAACALCIPHRLTHTAIVSGHTPPDACGVCPGSEDNKISLVASHQGLAMLGIGLIGRRLRRKPDKVIEKVTDAWTAADKQLVLCNPRYRRNLVANLRTATQCGPQGVVTDTQLLGKPWGFTLSCVPGTNVSIWQGGCDRIAHPSMGRYFHRALVGSRLYVDNCAGHVTMLKWHAGEILSQFYVEPTKT